MTNAFKLILNPTADKGKAIQRLPDIAAELNKHHIAYDITLTQYPWHAAEIAAQAVEEGYPNVVAVGGDGTINEVLNGLMLAKKSAVNLPRMGVLPIGRGNDFAYGMGIPADLTESCITLANGHSRLIDVGWLKGGLYPDGRYFGNGIGIGFDAMVGFLANQGKVSGFPGYLLAAIKTIAIFPPPVVEITFNSESLIMPCLLISVMNGRRMGGGFMMAPKSLVTDGKFDLIIAREVSKPGMFKLIPKFLKGTQFDHPAISFYQTDALIVSSIKGSMPIHADGETICVECSEMQISILPQQIDLIYQPGLPADV